MGWLSRMNLVIEHVEDHLHCGISIEDVAKIACCSKYHFHRVFYSYFNVTFAEYVRQRKLTLAATEVVSSQHSIMDIALKYGYDSPNAFTRAFRKIHGINPSKARTEGTKITTYNRVSVSPNDADDENMDYKIIERPAFILVGKSKDFDFDDFAKKGPKFWKDYVASKDYKTLCQLTQGQPGPVTHAPLLTAYFPTDTGSRDEFTDVLGIEFDSEEHIDGMDHRIVPAATYAEFECTYKSSMKTNRYIYGKWFDATGYERDGNKPDVVAYLPMPWQHFSEMTVRWWIPVVKKI